MKYLDLKDKYVVITGTNSGIGRGLCKAFLENDCRVIAVYREEKPDFLKQSNLFFLKADIRETEIFSLWLHDFEREGRKVEILVNNAGVYLDKPLLNCDKNDWAHIIDTNLKATFFLAQAFAKHMKKNSSGIIINATSFAARIPSTNSGLYAASKAALKSLTKVMAAEWAPYNIRVNSYSPGVISSRMTEPVIARKGDKLIDAISMRRIGKIEEVASVVLFLASSASSYITGEDINITGGKLITQNPEQAWKEENH